MERVVKRSYKRKNPKIIAAAKKEIDLLFSKAEEEFSKAKGRKGQEQANRYVRKAIRKAMSVKISLNRYKKYKERYCKFCHSYLKPGTNLIIRIKNGERRLTCKECGKTRRIKLSPKKTRTRPRQDNKK